MEKNRLNYLVSRYIQNAINRAEYVELMDYIQNEENDNLMKEIMDENWLTASNQVGDDKISRGAYERIIKDERFRDSSKKIKRIKDFRWLSLAASVLLICIMGLFVFRDNVQPKKVHIKVVAVPAGSRAKVTLPDGTLVWLNSESKLQYPSAFDEKSRSVSLSGEAYFDVAHDIKRPFIVHAGKTRTEVLGTAFNITAYRAEDFVVAVAQGKVRVSDQQRCLAELIPNKQLRYNSVTGKAMREEVDAKELMSWVDGELRLDNVTMGEAAEKISRWYNVEFAFANAGVRRCRFSVAFLDNEKLTKVLDVICQLNGLKYTIKSRKVFISGKGC